MDVLRCEASSYMETIKSKNPKLAEDSDLLKPGNRMYEHSRSSLNDSILKLLNGLRFILPGKYINHKHFPGS